MILDLCFYASTLFTCGSFKKWAQWWVQSAPMHFMNLALVIVTCDLGHNDPLEWHFMPHAMVIATCHWRHVIWVRMTHWNDTSCHMQWWLLYAIEGMWFGSEWPIGMTFHATCNGDCYMPLKACDLGQKDPKNAISCNMQWWLLHAIEGMWFGSEWPIGMTFHATCNVDCYMPLKTNGRVKTTMSMEHAIAYCCVEASGSVAVWGFSWVVEPISHQKCPRGSKEVEAAAW